MQEIRMPLQLFDLDGFIKETLEFLKTVVSEECDPSYAITWSSAPGGYPYDGDQKGWDFKSKLMNEPIYLFFPFAHFVEDKLVGCADGRFYQCPWKNTGYWDPADEGEEGDDIPFTVEDHVGYLVRVEDGTIIFSLATSGPFAGIPPIKVIPLSDGDFLAKPLIAFIKRFITGH